VQQNTGIGDDWNALRARQLEIGGATCEALMRRLILALLLFQAALVSASAQQPGRPEDGYYSGQSGAPSNGRVDGRPNKREGLPPSAADRSNGNRDNPISGSDCAEVDQLNPNYRPGFQDRIRRACGE
jgi:hypothetical protein